MDSKDASGGQRLGGRHECVSPGHRPRRGTQLEVRFYTVDPVLGEEIVWDDGWGSPVEEKS